MDVSTTLTILVWPLLILALALLFRAQMSGVIQRSSKLKIEAPGGFKFEVTQQEAKTILEELLKELTESTQELKKEEIELFQKIQDAGGIHSVQDLLPQFERGNEYHKQLQHLRNRKLVHPVEGGRWEKWKHPVVTRFGISVRKVLGEELLKRLQAPPK